ncbi:hypothetical protein H4Q26_016549 [Puccinia striiformis f. sp. tritici PST-130]|nr:hypothetical protein H4Q26_016549 [Puccinia striiformis f. sp. tritici PST-130]
MRESSPPLGVASSTTPLATRQPPSTPKTNHIDPNAPRKKYCTHHFKLANPLKTTQHTHSKCLKAPPPRSKKIDQEKEKKEKEEHGDQDEKEDDQDEKEEETDEKDEENTQTQDDIYKQLKEELKQEEIFESCLNMLENQSGDVKLVNTKTEEKKEEKTEKNMKQIENPKKNQNKPEDIVPNCEMDEDKGLNTKTEEMIKEKN